jgi:di/tripeptidase
MKHIHTAEEQIAVADLEAMVAVTLELFAAAREV